MNNKRKMYTNAIVGALCALAVFYAVRYMLHKESPNIAWEGQYTGVENGATSVLTLTQAGDGRYAMELDGGFSQPNSGAAAECEVKALGSVSGTHIEGRFQAIDTDNIRYSQIDADREGRMVSVDVRDAVVNVLQADTDGYCGLGVTFVGHYTKK